MDFLINKFLNFFRKMSLKPIPRLSCHTGLSGVDHIFMNRNFLCHDCYMKEALFKKRAIIGPTNYIDDYQYLSLNGVRIIEFRYSNFTGMVVKVNVLDTEACLAFSSVLDNIISDAVNMREEAERKRKAESMIKSKENSLRIKKWVERYGK